MSERVLVCGGRDFGDRNFVFLVLDAIDAVEGVGAVIEGGASGADKLAYAWAAKNFVKVEHFPADWQKHGKAAGPIRNQQMLDEGKPTLVVAFPGGRGTADMIRRAEAAGVEVKRVHP